MLTAHISIFICIFFVALGIVNLIPGLWTAYQSRYQASSQRTARELDKFFLNVKPSRIMIGAALMGGVLGYLSGSWVLAVAVTLLGLLAPRLLLTVWKEIRSGKFEAQLMDALLLMSNTLKSGLDIVAGIERVATSMPAPISEEFNRVLNSYRLGSTLEMALMELTNRINSRTLETVIYAINIQRETGGNIIKTFDQLVLTIREEGKLQKKVRAITSQGRTQIFFLAAFPWALALVFYFTAPDFMAPALASSWGQITLVVLILWECVGILITRKIVEVDV